MKLLWLTVSGEYALQLSSDLTKKGYRVTEVASTGDFLHYGNTILLMCIEAQQMNELTDFLRSRMNEYRHLHETGSAVSSTNDFALYSIPLCNYKKTTE